MKTRVVTFHYTLKDKSGQTIDSSVNGEPLAYLEGSGQIIPGLETELRILKPGDKKKVSVKAEDAYGAYDKSLLVDIPKEELPQGGEVKVGDQFRAGSSMEDSRVLRVVKVSNTHVTMDANHPLAGQDLFFDVEITSTRDATQGEIEHGHAHGGDGHHHHHHHDHDHDDEG